jgi:serine/threonine protein phosphatase PrpC
MSTDARLEIAAGFASERGPRADNQDFGGVHIGPAAEQRVHGVIAVVADGVSGGKAGRAASELAVRNFIDGYLDQNPMVGVAAAGLTALRGYNRWLHSRAKSDPAMEGAATTFTAAVMRGREATVLHVGDSRAWHFRDGVLSRLTEDHVLDRPGLKHVLYRAVGIEQDIRLDVRAVQLEPHDRLLLTSDGVHGVVDEETLTRLLARRGSPDADARAVVEAAGAAGTTDNATAVLIDVVRVGAVDWDSLGDEAERLPIGPVPEVGDNVDGFVLERLLSDGRYTRLFLARDGLEGGGERISGPVVAKFPKPAILSEKGARSAFLRESFIGRRIDSPLVGRVLDLPAGRQSRLYIVQPFHEGGTLHARLADDGPFDIQGGVALAIRLTRAVAALHRLGVAHRDIKPDNVILEKDGGIKLIDLGGGRVWGVGVFAGAPAPGTPGYMAPELFDGAPGDAKSDQFALGVTLYRVFTKTYPWGEVDADSRPRFDHRPTPATRHRPDMPAWLEAVLSRTIALDPDDRFADLDEMLHVLESGSALAVRPRESLSLIEKDPVRFWQGVCLLLVLALLVSLATR